MVAVSSQHAELRRCAPSGRRPQPCRDAARPPPLTSDEAVFRESRRQARSLHPPFHQPLGLLAGGVDGERVFRVLGAAGAACMGGPGVCGSTPGVCAGAGAQLATVRQGRPPLRVLLLRSAKPHRSPPPPPPPPPSHPAGTSHSHNGAGAQLEAVHHADLQLRAHHQHRRTPRLEGL